MILSAQLYQSHLYNNIIVILSHALPYESSLGHMALTDSLSQGQINFKMPTFTLAGRYPGILS